MSMPDGYKMDEKNGKHEKWCLTWNLGTRLLSQSATTSFYIQINDNSLTKTQGISNVGLVWLLTKIRVKSPLFVLIIASAGLSQLNSIF